MKYCMAMSEHCRRKLSTRQNQGNVKLFKRRFETRKGCLLYDQSNVQKKQSLCTGKTVQTHCILL